MKNFSVAPFSLALAVALLVSNSTLAQPASLVTEPMYVPDFSHAGEPMAEGVLAWDGISKSAEVTMGEEFAHFVFTFTNITSDKVSILTVQPSCGCTTVELPPVPWTIAANGTGQIKLNVNLAGKNGVLMKSATVQTDKGSKMLGLRIDILPAPAAPSMTDEERAHALAAAKIDRQAVFKNDCATCHVKPTEGKFDKALYDTACGICHESEHRASMVPDLHALKVPTDAEFWRAWITLGKPGTLMPAFATSQGGPLTDLQIASLAAYLNGAIPSHAPVPQ